MVTVQGGLMLHHLCFGQNMSPFKKSTGYSPFYMAHGIEPLLPFDLAEATYLAPKLDLLVSMEDLIAARAKMLQKQLEDLLWVQSQVLKAQWKSVKEMERSMKNKIQDFNFLPGSPETQSLTRGLMIRQSPSTLGPWLSSRELKEACFLGNHLDIENRAENWSSTSKSIYYKKKKVFFEV